MTIWKGLGYNTIIYLAGLQNIPKDYYEAADIDGASKIKQFFRITIPLVSPTTFYVLLMTTIVSFQAFAQIYLMTDKGGPLDTTKLIVYYIYDRGFDALNMGYASAVAPSCLSSCWPSRLSRNVWKSMFTIDGRHE